MRLAVLLSVLVLCGCNNNAANKANFEACVERAERKYLKAEVDSLVCNYGSCRYNVQTNQSQMQSRDNEISACATMYAPSK